MYFLAILGVMLAMSVPSSEPVYRVAEKPWPPELGHQRVVLQAPEPGNHIAHIPWRRRDRDPEKKDVIVTTAAGERLKNVFVATMTREEGDIDFEAPAAGTYFVYYLRYTVQMQYGGYGGNYTPPQDTADPAWLARVRARTDFPIATVSTFEARTDFDRLDPMEVVATADEVATLVAAHPEPYLVFPEDRKKPIRMQDDVPYRWTVLGPSARFTGEAQPNEYYAFQIGLFAAHQALDDVRIEFSDLVAAGFSLRPDEGERRIEPAATRTTGAPPLKIPASAVHCINTGGVDTDGKPFTKRVEVPQGHVQAVWLGVDIPHEAKAGMYRGTVTIRPANVPATEVSVELKVAGNAIEDRGDSEPWRYSRLRWLDSTIGEDDEVVAPYTALKVSGRTVSGMSGSVRFGADALPASIKARKIDVLQEPARFVVEGAELTWGTPKIMKRSPGSVVWESHAKGPVEAICTANMEFDGTVTYKVALRAVERATVKDIRLELPFKPESATYMMGAGRKGGLRPKVYDWKWAGPQDSFWIGGVHAGLHVEMRGSTYHGPMLNIYHPAPPASWSNGGKGGVSVHEESGKVVASVYSGERDLKPGDELTFEFALLITPVKPLDAARHFKERYYHNPAAPGPTPEAIAAGVNTINVHHANSINPFINYPFIATDKMREFVRQWHEKGMKVKIYYTVRELTNHVTEMWALRSLGTEALAGGNGGGFTWLREHLGTDYTPAWYQPYPDGTACAAILTSGESRWYNYYVEGLGWLVKNIGIDGLYLDDVTYDRRILKRMRKVMERNHPGCMIDLHSNDAFSIGPANQYTEFFPYVDRLWFGESFDYEAMRPDEWLVQTAGIPFGLMGDMLQNGGNRWRGMVYGMTVRLPWQSESNHANPIPVWKLWNEFGIASSNMVGYWEPSCPVRTDNPDILATAYVARGKTLISIGSWSKTVANVHLTIDWKALGLDPRRAVLRAPAVTDFQDARTFAPGDAIPVEPSRGWLLIVEEAR